jgi:hypothetical protein
MQAGVAELHLEMRYLSRNAVGEHYLMDSRLFCGFNDGLLFQPRP